MFKKHSKIIIKLFLLILIFLSMKLRSQTISGRITDAYTNKVIVGAFVKLLESNQQTTTDKEGKFILNGQGNITVSFIGYKKIQIKAKKVFLEIALEPTTTELQSVEVVGRNRKDYNSDYSFSATKIAIKNRELPQSLSTITKELISDRGAFQLADAVKIASGVSPSSFYNQYNIRGISQNEEGQIINGMRTRQYYFLQPITANIERVEVLKGPASVTFSSVDPGGSINIVTKKPLTETRREFSLTTGSFNLIRSTIDFTGPLNESKSLLYRINGAFQEAQSYRDLVKNNSFLISPSITYLPNDNTAINTEMIFSDMEGNLDRGQPIFGAINGVTKLNSTSTSLNLGASNDFFKSKEVILMTNLSHKFSEKINLNVSYMKQTWTEDLQEHRTTNAFAKDTSGAEINSLVGMQLVQESFYKSCVKLLG